MRYRILWRAEGQPEVRTRAGGDSITLALCRTPDAYTDMLRRGYSPDAIYAGQWVIEDAHGGRAPILEPVRREIVTERAVSRTGIQRVIRYDLGVPSDIARYVARSGDWHYALTDTGRVLCAYCCWDEYAIIAPAIPGDGWYVVDYGVVDEDLPPMTCDHCGREI